MTNKTTHRPAQASRFLRPTLIALTVALTLATAATSASAQDLNGRLRRALDPRGANSVHVSPRYADPAMDPSGLPMGAMAPGFFRSVEQASQHMLPQDMRAIDDSGQVVMYRTASCGYCKLAARHMQKNQIAYVEYDIQHDRTANARFQRYGGSGGVPLIVFGRKTLRGFNAQSFDTLYAEYSGGGGMSNEAGGQRAAPYGAAGHGYGQGQGYGQPPNPDAQDLRGDPSAAGDNAAGEWSRERGAAQFDRNRWQPR